MPKQDKQVIIDYIISCIKVGEQRGNILVKAGKKWGTSKSAFDRLLKIAKEQHNAKQGIIADKLLAIDTADAIETRRKGLKSKFDRVLELQDEIEIMRKQLRGEIEFTFIVGSKIMNSHNKGVFMLPVQIQNELRNQIKIYLSEISKIEGDYAAQKQDVRIQKLGADLEDETYV